MCNENANNEFIALVLVLCRNERKVYYAWLNRAKHTNAHEARARALVLCVMRVHFAINRQCEIVPKYTKPA